MLTKMLASTKNDLIQRTFSYYFLFICLGLNMAITGPTLPALATQTNSKIGQMGLLFLASSSGYILGTLISGRIFDRARGHLVLGIAQLFVAVFLVLITLTHWLWVLLVILVCMGVAGGFINTGGNILMVWTHGEKVGPFMNALHFFFGLGAFLSPLLIAQVIGVAGGYRWGYWILAVVAILVGLRMLTTPGNPRPSFAKVGETVRHVGPIPVGLIISAMLFFFFYVGAEIAFGGWIYTYAISLKLASIVMAAYLNSAFWLSFTIGRLISIPIATRFTPKQVILTALLSSLCVLIIGMMFSNSSTVLWLMVIGLGFCMAPIYATGFTQAGQSIALTGLLTSLILLGDSLGGMVLPSVVGQVIESTSPQAMIYLIFGSLALTLLAFFGMLHLRPDKPSSSP
jgi:MFS transporter, FHS family, Na+ dependent glucose transporter 1